jgi:hypothetical protein
MKFNFRKIASALASTAMLGSTVALAAAANYPAPFVQNGAADVAIVYGNSLDLVAVADISTSLSSALASGESTSALNTGAYGLFTGSTPLELNKSINSVRTSITDANLPGALGDSDFSGNVDADITFQIIPGSHPRTVFAKEPTSSDDPGVGILLSTVARNYFYNATATFSRAINFTHAESEGEGISLFGKEFTVASATSETDLVLFKSAQKSFLSVGGASPVPTKTVDIDGETYTIELVAATDTSATIRVTDSSGEDDQKEINEASSKKILGLEVAVNNADESDATNTLSAEIIVGSNKLTFVDGAEVTVGSDNDPIRGTKVDFESTAGTNRTDALTKLTVQVFAPEQSEDFLQEGDEFVDPVFGGFRFVLEGLDNNDAADREDISIDVSGSDKMTIGMSNWQGKSISNFVWQNNKSNSWGRAFLGDSNDWPIYTAEMALINESAYAVVGNEEDGYLVNLRTLSNLSLSGGSLYAGDNIVFENVFDKSQTWEAIISSEGSGRIDIGGKSYGITYRDDNTGDGRAYVQLNYPDSAGADDIVLFPTFETSKGAKAFFYEPLTIKLDNWDGTSSNATKLRFPDGDGYTDVVISSSNAADGNWTIGSNVLTLNQTAASSPGGLVASTYPVIGRLTYNITKSVLGGASLMNGTTLGGQSTLDANGEGENNTIVLTLMDPSSNTSITRPGFGLFQEQDESGVYEAVVVITGGAGNSNAGTGVTDIDFTWDGDTDMGTGATAWDASGVRMESNDDMYQMMDQWGTLVTTDQSDSDQYTSVISYPDEQVSVLLYVDAIGSGSGSTTLGDVKVMDDELSNSSMATKNLIVVGGSCVNTAASSLLNNAGCGASWTAATGASSGDWIIQTWANPWGASKIATLVAGWERADTANAATYLTTQNPLTTVGHKLTGKTGTVATVVTA